MLDPHANTTHHPPSTKGAHDDITRFPNIAQLIGLKPISLGIFIKKISTCHLLFFLVGEPLRLVMQSTSSQDFPGDLQELHILRRRRSVLAQ
jgi:hypothetical protein